MVQYLPGPEALLAPAAQQLTQGVIDFLDPTRKFQDAAMATIARNPEAAQQFANIEATSPGFLQSMGVGKLASIAPTPEAQYAAQHQQDIVAGLSAEQQAKTKSALWQGTVLDTANLLNEKYGLAKENALRMATGMNSYETSKAKLDELRTKYATNILTGENLGLPPSQGGMTDVQKQVGQQALTGMTPGQSAKDALEARVNQFAQKWMDAGSPPITWEQLQKQGFTPEEMGALGGTPMGNILIHMINYQAMQARTNDMMARQQEAQNFALYQALKPLLPPGIEMSQADFGAIRTGASFPPGSRLDTLQKAVGQAYQTMGQIKTAGMQNINTDNVSNLLSKFETSDQKDQTRAGDQARAGYVAQLNAELKKQGSGYTASYEPISRRPFTGTEAPPGAVVKTTKNELVVRGPNGETITDPHGFLWNIVTGGAGGKQPTPPPSSKDTAAVGAAGIKPTAQKAPLEGKILANFTQAWSNPPAGTADSVWKSALIKDWQTKLSPDQFAYLRQVLSIPDNLVK